MAIAANITPVGQSSGSAGFNQSSGINASYGQNTSQSYIPEYSTTPILEGIAKYSQQMAPQVYQWGMDQFNKNQGNIDTLMRNAMSYASPQRVAQEMGMAQSGVMQGAEAGRQNAMRDLQSYGIDPSSGRYAGLDTANRVMSGAAAAGAGNQQRMATQAAGNAMQQQAIQASNANVATGYGASNAMNQLLGTGMQLKYPPLGTTAQGTTASMGATQSSGGTVSGSGNQPYVFKHPQYSPLAKGGYIPDELSPSDGKAVDDVKANLTSGEFVIPRDVVAFKGQEFFYKLMAQARKMRAMGGGDGGNDGEQQPSLGYGAA